MDKQDAALVTVLECGLNAPVRLRSVDFRLILLTEGRCEVTTPQGVFEACRFDAFLLQPDTPYRIRAVEAAKIIDVAFTQDAFMTACLPVLQGCPLLASFFVHSSERSDMTFLHFQKTPNAIRESVQRMLAEYRAQAPYFRQMLLCGLTSLLLQLSRSCRVESTATEAPGAQLVQRLMDYMVSHSAEVTLESLSEAFHYHPNTVASVLKKGTGKTFSQLLFQTRMSLAAQLLTHSRLSIREIAGQCGYSNTSYFYSRFHQYYGMTPGEYSLRAKPRATRARRDRAGRAVEPLVQSAQ